MTTIAWDGKALAGDTLGTRGNMKHFVPAKIFRLNDGRLYGGCGDFADVLAMRSWLDGEADRPVGLVDFSAMLIDADGRCELFGERGQTHAAPFPFFAIGSGRDFAIAAMHCRRSAREALDVACQYDAWTGGEVQVLELNPA